ncbi:DUF2264 domain-containing protein [uncultured Alsobacter sp.]|uniref:DUF2264 domain-containing protein n=1 Tax=uncultured Alsobacter sp. TaxID=1748258 RepID=UPI0025EC5CF4|nr:DUF2264 domain-containing protein [uncultured Alsobacter sp.]
MAGNPLRTRADVEAALRALWTPLETYRSPGKARIRLGHDSAHFDRAAADFEGFARPLWGLAPAAAGGAAWIDWAPIREGLANGTDPGHPEYWGAVGDVDQRMVELAALGYALRLVPDRLWEPLSSQAKDNVARWLTQARVRPFSTNNWKFFRVMIDLGLEAIGVAHDPAPTEQYLDEIDALYLGEGWYRDGPWRRVDHYIPFAFHFYGLLLAAYGRRADRAEAWRKRARVFAPDFDRWFAEDGAVVPYGRSMTYRFATGSFWGALAVAGVEALPWGVIKGHYLRHLRWWARQPIAHPDGVLSIGYAYPQRMMSEHYNSAGSPYWAFKAFAPLALPADHPFWQAQEAAGPEGDGHALQVHPGMVLTRPPGDVVALSCGQEDLEFRFGPEKYAKFAYSGRYGFSIEADERRFVDAVFDSMLGLSDDGRHYRVREGNEEALVSPEVLYARWHPWADVTVETVLMAHGAGHVRLHRIRTPRPLATSEGGFAVARTDGDRDLREAGDDWALAETSTDASLIVDLGPSTLRQPVVHRALPNTNLMAARTWIPQLRGTLQAGETVLACFACASPARDVVRAALAGRPAVPDFEALVERIRATGKVPGAMSGKVNPAVVPR